MTTAMRRTRRGYRPDLEALDGRAVPAVGLSAAALAAAQAADAATPDDHPYLITAEQKAVHPYAIFDVGERYERGLVNLANQFLTFQNRFASFALGQIAQLNSNLNAQLDARRTDFVNGINSTGAASPVSLTALQNQFNAQSNQVFATLTNLHNRSVNRFLNQVGLFTRSFNRFGPVFVDAGNAFSAAFAQAASDFGGIFNASANNILTDADTAFATFNDIFSSGAAAFNPDDIVGSLNVFNDQFDSALTDFGTLNNEQINLFGASFNAGVANFAAGFDVDTGILRNAIGFNATFPGGLTQPFLANFPIPSVPI